MSRHLEASSHRKPANPRRRVRRTQAERSGATRERVIVAAIEILNTRGYAGATTVAIRDAAGVSMGALQHQFPSKAQLMAAVLDRLISSRLAVYEAAGRDVADPRERILQLLDVSHSLTHETNDPATLEIQMAVRNDPELGEALRPLMSRKEARVKAMVDRIAAEAQLPDTARLEQLRLLHSAMLRGLVAELAAGGSRDGVDAALAEWRDIASKLFTEAMGAGKVSRRK